MHRYIPRRDGAPLSEKIRMKQDHLPLPTTLPACRPVPAPVSVDGPSVLSPTSSKRPSPASSTPCRRIRTKFFGPRPKEEEEHQRHEERLAKALEIDKTAKILDFRVHPARAPRAEYTIQIFASSTGKLRFAKDHLCFIKLTLVARLNQITTQPASGAVQSPPSAGPGG